MTQPNKRLYVVSTMMRSYSFASSVEEAKSQVDVALSDGQYELFAQKAELVAESGRPPADQVLVYRLGQFISMADALEQDEEARRSDEASLLQLTLPLGDVD